MFCLARDRLSVTVESSAITIRARDSQRSTGESGLTWHRIGYDSAGG